MISSTCYQNISKLGFVFISFLLGNFFPDCLFLRGMILSVVGKIMLGCGVVWPYRDTDWPEIWESPLAPSCPSCHPTFIVIAHQLVLTLDVPSICTLLSIPFVLCLVTQSCLTLCDPMDYSLPGFSVRGILQIRIWIGLEWIAISFFNPGIEPVSLMPPALADRFFITSTTWKISDCWQCWVFLDW